MKNFTVLFNFIFMLGVVSLNAHSHHIVVEEVYPAPVVMVEPSPQVTVITAPAQITVASDPNVIIVNQAPPAPIVETLTPSPGVNYACIEGHWVWNGRWVWKSHEWVLKPQPYAVWEPAHWHLSHHYNGYVWEPGRWK